MISGNADEYAPEALKVPKKSSNSAPGGTLVDVSQNVGQPGAWLGGSYSSFWAAPSFTMAYSAQPVHEHSAFEDFESKTTYLANKIQRHQVVAYSPRPLPQRWPTHRPA